jgi:alpha-beta hydrolase superfamily lysophospholipase
MAPDDAATDTLCHESSPDQEEEDLNSRETRPHRVGPALPNTPRFAIGGEPQRRGSDSEDATAARQALLRQFSLQRMMGYGMELGDALTLRRLVEEGFDWSPVAHQLANRAFMLAEWASSAQDDAGRRSALRRASANLRIAQVIDASDSVERRETYHRAERAFEEAVAQDSRFERVIVRQASDPIVCWLVRAREGSGQPLVAVVGGVEGWALDLVGYAAALGSYGLSTLLIDGPGQGQTRFVHAHYLTDQTPEALREVVRFARERLADGARVGFLGNSFGGNLVLHASSWNDDVGACCNNGGSYAPLSLSERPRFFNKMRAMCGPTSEADAIRVFKSLELKKTAFAVACPFLLVHGGADPIVTTEEAASIFKQITSSDKRMVTFPDGDHCIYNRPEDRFAVVGNFFAQALA